MHSKQHENLLSKKVADGVALKTQLSQNWLSRLRGYRKRTHTNFLFTKFSRVALGTLLLLYFAGYQPILALPPVKKALVLAASDQEQTIEAFHLSQPFQLPHPGYISTRFSSWHPGMDIATGLGMPVRPVAPGTVVEVTYGFLGLGHYVVLAHEQGFKSTYGHMGRIFVKKGDSVTNSSTLGEVGMTGRTTGPHTHLEVTKDGNYIDPALVLPALSNWPTSAGKAPQGEGEAASEVIPTATPTPKQKEPTEAPSKKTYLFNLEKWVEPDATKASILKGLYNFPF